MASTNSSDANPRLIGLFIPAPFEFPAMIGTGKQYLSDMNIERPLPQYGEEALLQTQLSDHLFKPRSLYSDPFAAGCQSRQRKCKQNKKSWIKP